MDSSQTCVLKDEIKSSCYQPICFYDQSQYVTHWGFLKFYFPIIWLFFSIESKDLKFYQTLTQKVGGLQPRFGVSVCPSSLCSSYFFVQARTFGRKVIETWLQAQMVDLGPQMCLLTISVKTADRKLSTWPKQPKIAVFKT